MEQFIIRLLFKAGLENQIIGSKFWDFFNPSLKPLKSWLLNPAEKYFVKEKTADNIYQTRDAHFKNAQTMNSPKLTIHFEWHAKALNAALPWWSGVMTIWCVDPEKDALRLNWLGVSSV